MKLKFVWQILLIVPIIKSYEYLSSGSLKSFEITELENFRIAISSCDIQTLPLNHSYTL